MFASVEVALHNTGRSSRVQSELVAPIAGLDTNGCTLLAEKRFLAEREENRAVQIGRMVEDVNTFFGRLQWVNKRGLKYNLIWDRKHIWKQTKTKTMQK